MQAMHSLPTRTSLRLNHHRCNQWLMHFSLTISQLMTARFCYHRLPQLSISRTRSHITALMFLQSVNSPQLFWIVNFNAALWIWASPQFRLFQCRHILGPRRIQLSRITTTSPRFRRSSLKTISHTRTRHRITIAMEMSCKRPRLTLQLSRASTI